MKTRYAAAAVGLMLVFPAHAELRTAVRLVLPEVQIDRKIMRSGDPIAVTLTITNRLSVALLHCTKSLVPTERNGEIVGIHLQAVYRYHDPLLGSLRVIGRPRLSYPILENALPCQRIEPGAQLTIKTNLGKWTVQGGWQVGTYRVSLRIDGLQPEGDPLTSISAISELVEFEIQG